VVDDRPQQFFYDDGFPITAAERWIKAKIEILGQYVSAVAMGLAGRVDDLVLVELFTGNGLFSLGAHKQVFPGVGLSALSQNLPITKFVFCERDPEQYRVLKIRVNRHFRGSNIILLEGKPEDLVEKIKMYIPPTKGRYRSAVIGICDPFSFDMPFDALEKLADWGFSFLIPFTFAINDRIDYRYYLKEHKDRLVKYLGSQGDFDRLQQETTSNSQFYKRMVQCYQNNMLARGMNGSVSIQRLESGLMEMPVYYIGFFSRILPTKSIQKEIEEGGHVQYDLFSGPSPAA